MKKGGSDRNMKGIYTTEVKGLMSNLQRTRNPDKSHWLLTEPGQMHFNLINQRKQNLVDIYATFLYRFEGNTRFHKKFYINAKIVKKRITN